MHAFALLQLCSARRHTVATAPNPRHAGHEMELQRQGSASSSGYGGGMQRPPLQHSGGGAGGPYARHSVDLSGSLPHGLPIPQARESLYQQVSLPDSQQRPGSLGQRGEPETQTEPPGAEGGG